MAATLTTIQTGPKSWVITVNEASAATGDTWRSDSAGGLPSFAFPRSGYMSIQWDGSAGQPRLGRRIAGWTDASKDRIRQTSAADQTSVEDGPFPFAFPSGVDCVLFGHSKFTAASGNSADWTIIIEGS